jgi:acetyltransferase
VRAVADPDNLEAEFAIAVRSDLKHQGLGTLLLDKMVAYLKGRGTRRMASEVLSENEAMRGLARRTGLRLDGSPVSGPSVRCVLDLQSMD